ncbi:MAG: energy transducer TonB [Bacteroidia bacterium]|nr:energy transducer TonB [Bacteroidia bacterium]
MKTKKTTIVSASLKILLVLPVIAAVIFAFSSCNQNKNSKATFNEIAPPPPPPPPAAPLSDSVYTVVDELAQFQDGDQGLMKYIAENTVYPDEAKKKNITGKVIVKFVVEKDGSVSRVEIIKGVNSLLDAEAVRVVNSLPKFEKPAKQGGIPVSVQYMLPITFSLK